MQKCIKWALSHRKMNKIQKMVNGNIGTNIKIMSWNKGNSHISSAMNEIRDYISEHKPDVFIINEFGIYENDDLSIASIQGYNLEIDNLRIKYQESRTGVYISERIIYERVEKYEAELSSSVCLKIGFKNKRKIYMCAFYRQFTVRHKDPLGISLRVRQA